MFAIVAVSLTVFAGPAVCPTAASDVAAALDVLPAGWRADVGVPLEWNGTVIHLFGDTWTDDPSIGNVRNTVVADGVAIPAAIPHTASGAYYWPGDGYELPDGRLFVVLGETRDLADPTDEQASTG